MDPHRLSSLKSKLSNIYRKSTLAGGIFFILANITIANCSENSTISTLAVSDFTADPIRFNANQSASIAIRNYRLSQNNISQKHAQHAEPLDIIGKYKQRPKTENSAQRIGSLVETSDNEAHSVPAVNILDNEIIDYHIKHKINVTTVEEYLNSTSEIGKRNKEIESNIKKLEEASLNNSTNPSNNITNINLEESSPEKRRYKRKNSIDRIGEYPHGYDHGLIVHHHLPPRLALPLTPDHHYYSYPGRIPRRPEKPGPIYLGTPKAPKLENDYYKELLPNPGSAKAHSLPPIFQQIPNENVHGKNYQYHYQAVEHPAPNLDEHIGYQIHHQVETPFYQQPTPSHPYNYSPTTPGPNYNYNPTTPPKVSPKPFVLIKTPPAVEHNLPGVNAGIAEYAPEHPPFNDGEDNILVGGEVAYKEPQKANEEYAEGPGEVSANESDFVESNINLPNYPEHSDNSNMGPSRLTLEDVYSATPAAVLDRDALNPTFASKPQIQDVVGTAWPKTISTDDLIYLKESYSENLIFTNLTSPKDKFDGTENIFLVNFVENLQESDEKLFPELAQSPRDGKSGFPTHGEVFVKNQLLLDEDKPISSIASDKETSIQTILSTAALGDGSTDSNEDIKYEGNSLFGDNNLSKLQSNINNHLPALPKPPPQAHSTLSPGTKTNHSSQYSSPDSEIQFVEPVNSISVPHISTTSVPISHLKNDAKLANLLQPPENAAIPLTPSVPTFADTIRASTEPTNSVYSNTPFNILPVEDIETKFQTHSTPPASLGHNYQFQQIGRSKPLMFFSTHKPHISSHSTPAVYPQATPKPPLHINHHGTSIQYQKHPTRDSLHHVHHHIQQHPTPTHTPIVSPHFDAPPSFAPPIVKPFVSSLPVIQTSAYPPPSTPGIEYQNFFSTTSPLNVLPHLSTIFPGSFSSAVSSPPPYNAIIYPPPPIVTPHFDTPPSFTTPVVRPFVSQPPIQPPVYPPQPIPSKKPQNFFSTATPLNVFPQTSTIFPGSFSGAVSSPPLTNAIIHPPPPTVISPFPQSHSSLPTNLKGTRSYMFSTIDGKATYAYNVTDGIADTNLAIKSNLHKGGGDQSLQALKPAKVKISGNTRQKGIVAKVVRKGRRRLKSRIRPAIPTVASSQSKFRHKIKQGEDLNKPLNPINPKNQRLTTKPNSFNLQKIPFSNFEKENVTNFSPTIAPSSRILPTTRSPSFISKFRQPKPHTPDPRTSIFPFESSKVKPNKRPKERRPNIPRNQRIKKVRKKPFTAFRTLEKGVLGFTPSTKNSVTRTNNNLLNKNTPVTATTATFTNVATKSTTPVLSTTPTKDFAANTISTTYTSTASSGSTISPEETREVTTEEVLESSTYFPDFKSETVHSKLLDINEPNSESSEDYSVPIGNDKTVQDGVNIDVVVPESVSKGIPEDSIDFNLPRNPKDYPDTLDTAIELNLPRTPTKLSPVSDPQLQLDLPTIPNTNLITSSDADYLDLPIRPTAPANFSVSSIDFEPPEDPSKNATIQDILLLLDLPKKPEPTEYLSYTIENQDLPNNPEETSLDYDYDANYDLPQNPTDDKPAAYEYDLRGTSTFHPSLTTTNSPVVNSRIKPEVFSDMLENSFEDDVSNGFTLISPLDQKTDELVKESFQHSLNEVTENQPFANEFNDALSTSTPTNIFEKSKSSQNLSDSTSGMKGISSKANSKLSSTNKQIKTTMKTISTVEVKDKNILMSKILDALAQSIDHPMKDKVVRKLKEELASSNGHVDKPSSIASNHVISTPQAIRVSKELRVLKKANENLFNFTKESPSSLDELDYDFSTIVDNLDGDENKMQNSALLDNVVDKARVVLFNRLRQGVNVEDTIRISLQPHLVDVVQPHVAKEVEDRIHFTYKDQVFVGKEDWIDHTLPLSAIPNPDAFLASTTVPHNLSTMKTGEKLQNSTKVIEKPVSDEEEKVDTVLNENSSTSNLKKARQRLEEITTLTPKSATLIIITPNPETTHLPFESTKIQVQSEKQLASERLSANNVTQEKNVDDNADKEIEVFNGVSVIQIPFPQNRKKTESTVNLPDFQELPKRPSTKTNINNTNKITTESKNNQRSRRRKILDRERASPRVKSDHLKFLREKFKSKTGRKANKKQPKFRNKKEKEKAIKFIIETLRKQRKQSKSSNAFTTPSLGTLIVDSTPSSAFQRTSSPNSTPSDVIKTTTDDVFHDETTYFPIPTDVPSGETTYFPIPAHTSKETSVQLDESITTGRTSSIQFTTATTPNLPPFSTLSTTASEAIVSSSTASNLHDTTIPTSSSPTKSVRSGKPNISQNGAMTSSIIDATPKSRQSSFESSEERTTSILKTLSAGSKEISDEVTATSAQLFDLISFEDLRSTTPRSNTDNPLISEPLEIIRSSVIVSQNHRNVNRGLNRLVSTVFPQSSSISVVRAPNGPLQTQNPNIINTNVDTTTLSNIKDNSFETNEIPMGAET